MVLGYVTSDKLIRKDQNLFFKSSNWAENQADVNIEVNSLFLNF